LSGYTPIYDHMLSGTLYGRWPHTGIWACLLSRASREGVIDEVPASLAAAIGVPVDLLLQCIHDFMQPDPGSRTKDHEGRRLELLDPNRDWGWRILNHGKYREKARKKNYDDDRTSSGTDAARKKIERESREVPTSPAKSRSVPLSEATPEANTDTDVVFDHWRVVHGHPKARIDAKRTKLIREALKLYSVDDLKRCIDGYKRSPWHQGKNDRKQVYDDIGLFLRDAEHIDAGIKIIDKKGPIEWM
jgi:hypothetical protein